VLRAHAVAAGLDPGFAVLDEPAARALRREAFDVALGRWLEGDGPASAAALDVAAAYGADRLGELVGEVHDELRSQGRTVTLPGAVAPDVAAAGARLEGAAAAAEAALAGATRTLSTLDKALAAVRACRATLAGAAPGALPPAAACAGWSFGAGRVRELQDERVAAYLEACAGYLRARDDAAAVPVLGCLDDLLRGFAGAYAAAKRARSAVDFADLELIARDLLRDQPAVAAALRERFARVMVDEFQDTNPLQLELLELLGVEATFVVGDELQAIYGFRHADVEVFRRRRAELAARGATAELATSFRARPDLLATLDHAFGPGHGEGYVPLVAGRGEPPDPAGRVEVLLTDVSAWDGATNGTTTPPAASPELTAALGAGLDADRPSLAAEARLVAQRVRALVDARECRAGEVVVLARALRALAPIERALQDLGFATLSGGGRGWWGRRQVRDLLAWLSALANPRDETALLGVLASPLCGVSSDALALLGLARPAREAALWDLLVAAYAEGDPHGLRPRLGRDDDERLERLVAHLVAERAVAPRHGLDELLDRVVRATRYDEHLLALRGGARRLANVRKLQRLAAGFEAREGRDVRGFVDLALAELEADAVETDAPVEVEGQDAVQLMTMHAAKGLEFKVVVCAGLGRAGNRQHPDVLLDGDRVGLRLMGLDGSSRPALDYEALADDRKARERAEERRVLHVAMTRAEERLVLSGAVTLGEKWPKPSHGAAPLSWLGPELLPDVASALSVEAPELTVAVGDDGGAVRAVLNAPGTVGRVLADPPAAAPRDGTPPPASAAHEVAAEVPPASSADELPEPPAPPAAEPPAEAGQLSFDFAAPALTPTPPAPTPAPPAAMPAVPAPAPAPARSAAVAATAAAPVRRPAAPPVATLSYSSLVDHAACGYRAYLRRTLRLGEVEPPPHLREDAARGPDARLRGTIVHEVLETADLRPGAPAPDAEAVRAVAADHDVVLSDEELADVLGLLAAFAGSSVRSRLATATAVQREAPFALLLGEPDRAPGEPAAPLLNGVVDALATEPDGTALVVDYKTDRTAGDEDLGALVARDYPLQRAAYALACLRAGHPAVEVVHLYLERAGEPVAVRHVAADAPSLEALLLDAARPLLDGDHRPAAAPYAGLCARCPGRGGLCSWPTSMTDRPDPEAPPVGEQAP
jgi:ATP-dependent exoDNAse (exonuclease V) beta subunit